MKLKLSLLLVIFSLFNVNQVFADSLQVKGDYLEWHKTDNTIELFCAPTGGWPAVLQGKVFNEAVLPEPTPTPVPEPTPTPEPTPPPTGCVATYCSLPLQSCDLPLLTGGVDSCGNPCSKPSLEWPNCRRADGSIGPKL